MKKFIISMLLVVGVGLIGAGFYFGNQDFDLIISEDLAMEKVQEKIPLTFKKKGITGVVNDLKLEFMDDDSVKIETSFDVEGYGMKGSGDATFKSGIYYEAGEFYLDRIELIDISLVPNKETTKTYNDESSKLKSNLARKWSKLKAKITKPGDQETNGTLDQLKGHLVKRFKTEAMPKLKKFAAEKIQHTIENTPIYSLNGKDYKQSVAALVLKDIFFEKHQVVIVLNPMQGIVTILLYLFGGLLLIGGIVVIFRSPKALNGIAAVGSAGVDLIS